MTVLQRIDPPITLWIPEKNDYGLAHWILYQGIEEYLYFICFMEKTGECWTFDNRKVRGDVNITLGRVYEKAKRAP